MFMSIHRELHEDLERASPARLELTRRAFRLLPALDRPRILDIGCGRGGPTLELAELTDGEVVGLDIDQEALDELAAGIAWRGLGDRVRFVHGSMSNMDFAPESFDVIWAEGSIHLVGFEVGLETCRRFLRQGGFLVVHEVAWIRPDPPREIAGHWRGLYPGIRTVAEYLAEIPCHGYDLIAHFVLPEDFWWFDYYGPLESRIRELREKYADEPGTLEALDREQREVDLYEKYSRWYGSAFFAMRKR